MDKYLVPKNKNLVRFGILPVEAVISVFKEIESMPNGSHVKPMIEAFGHLISTAGNLKLRTFIVHGTTCKCCGIPATFFAVEYDKNDPEKAIILNLYSIHENGKEILMNMDHRLPRFRGGADCVENMQTMCQPCNLKKGCKLIFTEGGISKKELKAQSKQQAARSKKL